MKARPPEVDDGDLRNALADDWGIEVQAMRYAPVGGGSYHWEVTGDGQQWFVTVDDLDDKGWLGKTRPEVFAGLRAALDTAVMLRDQAELSFVLAPVPAVGGDIVRELRPGYSVAVFPFISGEAGQFGVPLPPPRRAELVDILAALHQYAPAATGVTARVSQPELSQREALERALGQLAQPWLTGPFGEPARALLAGAVDWLRHQLDDFDELAGQVLATGTRVITHGEPHPGNVLWAGGRTMLIDWDTVGLAPPERDLWLVAGPDGTELRRYADATGTKPDPNTLELYRRRWMLEDIAIAVAQFHAAHSRNADTERDLTYLKQVLGQATENPQ